MQLAGCPAEANKSYRHNMLSAVNNSQLPQIREWAAKHPEYFRRMPAPWSHEFEAALAGQMFFKHGTTQGLCSLSGIDFLSRQAELGMLLDGPREEHEEAFHEMAWALCDYAFNQLGLQKLTAKTLAHREALHKRLEAVGFRWQGYLERNVFFQGALHDEMQHALFVEDFRRIYG